LRQAQPSGSSVCFQTILFYLKLPVEIYDKGQKIVVLIHMQSIFFNIIHRRSAYGVVTSSCWQLNFARLSVQGSGGDFERLDARHIRYTIYHNKCEK
jgi:hypothetical protein